MSRVWKKREMPPTRVTRGMLAIVSDPQGIWQETLPQLDTVAALDAPGPEDGE